MGQAKRKRVRAIARFQELDGLFNDLGITSRDPGFYDDPHFMAAESDDPRFLENYAEWVNLRPRSAEYDDHVRHIVPRLAQMVFAKVEALGQHGRCVDASNLLSRSLDRLGVWNYIAVGAFNVGLTAFPKLERRYFWVVDELDEGAGQLGHVWVVAPPFPIVDVTIKVQGWNPDFERAMPDLIASETCKHIRMDVQDMVANEFLYQFAQQNAGRVPNDLHLQMRPYLRDFEQVFPGVAVKTIHIQARYLPTGIRASLEPLQDLFAGDGTKFWNEVVAPNFDKNLITD